MQVGKVSFGMQLKNPENWEKAKIINHDAFGSSIINFSKEWAESMEDKVQDGFYSVKEVAEETSDEIREKHKVNGDAFVCSVYLLSTCWKYGNALQAWFQDINNRTSHDGIEAHVRHDGITAHLTH